MKAVRTDQELECPEIDAGLRARGVEAQVVEQQALAVQQAFLGAGRELVLEEADRETHPAALERAQRRIVEGAA